MTLRSEAVDVTTWWQFQPGEHVMTIDGYPGIVDRIEDGPGPDMENYVVTLDNNLGGGNYSASMLSKMPGSREASGVHLAKDDYPELGNILIERPDPGKMTFTAAAGGAAPEAQGEQEDGDLPSSCSYCGSTDFKDLTDNGRVRQATCATCGGTMSAHPGMQWTPELIGDPSNHPSPAVDPRSGASQGGGQAGINDFVDFDSRVSTTASAEGGKDIQTIPTKRVGFAGYIEGEKTNFANHSDNPDWEDEQAVGQHTGVHEFRSYSGRENDFAQWHEKGEITHVPLKGPKVYATQARVTKRGVDHYLNNPDHKPSSGRPNYPANDRPIFVKHGGDYFTLDGHHRTAAAMLRGDEHVEGHVYDADKHGFPEPEWSPFSKQLPRSLEKYSALAGACGFDTDDEADVLQHELDYHDDGFCSARGHVDESSLPRHDFAEPMHHTAAMDGPDWCTWRRDAQCTFPNDRNNTLLAIPQVRGACPWETRWQQQVCPISEPGPMALMQAKGSLELPERVASSTTTAALEAHMASDDDYRMQHRAPGGGEDDVSAPLHDVESMMPDFYEHPEYYSHGVDHAHESVSVIRSARGNPEKKIRIYRALPAEHAHKGIQSGDWVSTSKNYARDHGREADPKHDWPVISAMVPAKHLHTEGEIHEWGYNGPPRVGMVSFKGGYHQEVRQGDEGVVPVKRRPKKEASGTTAAFARLAHQMAQVLGPGSANTAQPRSINHARITASTDEWFHGTRHTFKPGDILTGGHARSNQGYGQPGQHVYYSGRRDVASAFAEAAHGPDEDYDAQPRVYRVRPVEGHEQDPDEEPELRSFRAPKVEVLDEVPFDHEGLHRLYGDD